VIPVVEHELPALIPLQDDLARLGVRPWLPDLKPARAAIDKAVLHQVPHQYGILVLRSLIGISVLSRSPPRTGQDTVTGQARWRPLHASG
jgi:hypothetical protein